MKVKGIKTGSIYKATVCQRCGECLFSEYIDTKEFDGGYTRVNEFESVPDGWQRHDTTGYLCPSCEALYQSQLKSFMTYTEECESGI